MKKVMSILMAVAMLFVMYGGVFAFSGITAIPSAPNGAAGIAGTVIGVMKWFGYAIAIGMLVYIGIKYIMASANEKADLKNALIKYAIGAVIIVFAVNIADWIFLITVPVAEGN